MFLVTVVTMFSLPMYGCGLDNDVSSKLATGSENQGPADNYLGLTKSPSGEGIRVVLAPCLPKRLEYVVVRRDRLPDDTVMWEVEGPAEGAEPVSHFDIGQELVGATESKPLRDLSDNERYSVTIVGVPDLGEEGLALAGSTFTPSQVPRGQLLVGNRVVDAADFADITC